MHPALTADAQLADREAILTRAALAAAERLGLSARQFANVIGVSEPTVSRMKRGEARLRAGGKDFELAACLIRVFRSLDAITGGDETASRAWMAAPNTALGARPSELLTSVHGLLDVAAYLDARRAPI